MPIGSYLSPANGEPVLYINIKNHVTSATNKDFQTLINVLRLLSCYITLPSLGHTLTCLPPPLVNPGVLAAENAYLSPANGEPVLYINIEDHVTYATGKPNEDFQAILNILRSPVCGPARLHWGKAGWPQHAKCFDGAKEYPKWCDFGCAVQQLDPYGKFAGMSDVWQWRAVDKVTGSGVDFGGCCTTTGFDYARCSCASRGSCS